MRTNDCQHQLVPTWAPTRCIDVRDHDAVRRHSVYFLRCDAYGCDYREPCTQAEYEAYHGEGRQTA